jgi:hypothetical protein
MFKRWKGVHNGHHIMMLFLCPGQRKDHWLCHSVLNPGHTAPFTLQKVSFDCKHKHNQATGCMTDAEQFWQIRRSENGTSCWFRHDTPTAKTAHKATASLQYSLISALLDEAFDHHDLLISRRPTSLRADFREKEFVRITHETRRNWNTVFNTLLPTLAQKHFVKSHKTLKSARLSSSRR